jgi:hypothetical protein
MTQVSRVYTIPSEWEETTSQVDSTGGKTTSSSSMPLVEMNHIDFSFSTARATPLDARVDARLRKHARETRACPATAPRHRPRDLLARTPSHTPGRATRRGTFEKSQNKVHYFEDNHPHPVPLRVPRFTSRLERWRGRGCIDAGLPPLGRQLPGLYVFLFFSIAFHEAVPSA